MAREVKNKKALFAIVGVMILALVGGAFALNYTRFVIGNDFVLGYFEQEIAEKFQSPTGWTPCDETEKLITIKNTGNISAQARVGMDQSWVAEDGSDLALVYNNMVLAQIDMADNWDLTDGYYYYDGLIEPGQTVTFIRGVTLNCNANFAENQICDGEGQCVNTTNPYSGATYNLNAKVQLLSENADVSWDDAFSDYKPPRTFSRLASGFATAFRNVASGRTITAFKRSKVLADAATVSNRTQVEISGDTPIFLWYSTDDSSMYWYSQADAATWNGSDSIGGIFSGLMFNNKPDDISGLEYFDMHNLTSLGGFVYGNFPDDITPLAHWDVSGVTNLGNVFSSSLFKQEHMPGLKNWKLNTTNLQLASAFSGNPNITNLDDLSEWDTSGVTNMSAIFAGMSNLSDISGISGWDVSNVTIFSSAFASMNSLTDVSPLAGWDVSSGTNFSYMFAGSSHLTDATSLNGWTLSAGANKSGAFDGTGCTTGTYPSWY